MLKERLDELLVKLKLAEDLNTARALIMAGKVIVDEHRIDKAGTLIKSTSKIRLKKQIPYVSRGGLKLEKAIKTFNIDFSNKTVIDIGSSTGGFTDVALRFNAKKVYAIDVGKALLHNKLLTDSRVISMEGVNFRYLEKDKINDDIDIFVTDVSFISLTKIISNMINISSKNFDFIALIKPQFEAERDKVEKNGIVSNFETHCEVILKIINFSSKHSLILKGLTSSPIKGAKGNVEYLAYFTYCGKKDIDYSENEINEIIKKVVYENRSFNS